MTRPQLAIRVGAGWMACTAALFITLGPSSTVNLITFAVVGLLMPAVLVALTGTYPPPTVAELLHDAESGQ